MAMSSTQRERARRSLDRRFAQIAPVIGRRPPTGWIRSVREALGMSVTELANRMEVTKSRVTQLERAEVHGNVQLSTLERAADALGCDLVYVLLPRSGSLEADVAAQARSRALEQVRAAAHTMALENQATEPDEALVAELATAAARSRGLWR